MSTEVKKEKKSRSFRTPDTYVIIFFVVLFAALLTYLVPLGQFDTQEVTFQKADGSEDTRTVPIPESFRIVTNENGNPVKEGVGLFKPFGGVGALNYAFEGLASGSKWGTAVGVVAFILVIGGAFGIILRTGAVEAGILSMIKKTQGKESLIIPILFLLFSAGGAIFGMGEEAIPFAMIVVPIVIAMGYDAITGIMITYVATQIGFATSWQNPFGVAIAQGVSGVPVMSGFWFRFIMWIFFTVVGITYTWIYAKKIKKDLTKSVSYESDAFYREDFKGKEHIDVKFELGHALVLLTILLGVIWVVWGVVKHAYYIPSIASQFFIMGLVAGIIGVIFKLNDMTLNDIATSFRDGAKDLVGAALVVGMANGIILVLGGTNPGEPTVLNTILHSIGNAVGSLPSAVSAWFMYLFQSIFNFFVVSGSGQAALVMPLMAPLADIVGVTRQVAVLAYQLGDGFTNLIVPTSGCLMGVLGVAKLDWGKWAKWQIKFQGILFVLGSVFVIVAALIGFN
ncbi:putative basic amino acid antiporter YfcC [Caldisalinibacter kiritimatiensis]|uniref:Short-chain fatty acids transporter n=1 Tax=Caldisalinibacter kiritimatiensis TaxID=1304284 RepID=R1AQ41_9FIRM|nr:putative basic amino acid antiporter YfcC [Caldisalinibacter kiritimatiensis]EOC99247.1 Short-chain fatty acids transporter [Caldisalinibacter kiritimatiensis]